MTDVILTAILEELTTIRTLLEERRPGAVQAQAEERWLSMMLPRWHQVTREWLTSAQVLALELPGCPETTPRLLHRRLVVAKGSMVRVLGTAQVLRLELRAHHNQAQWRVVCA